MVLHPRHGYVDVNDLYINLSNRICENYAAKVDRAEEMATQKADVEEKRTVNEVESFARCLSSHSCDYRGPLCHFPHVLGKPKTVLYRNEPLAFLSGSSVF